MPLYAPLEITDLIMNSCNEIYMFFDGHPGPPSVLIKHLIYCSTKYSIINYKNIMCLNISCCATDLVVPSNGISFMPSWSQSDQDLDIFEQCILVVYNGRGHSNS